MTPVRHAEEFIDLNLHHRRAAIVAAHPDDETLGAGGILPLLSDPAVIHVTDGSPRDLYDARSNGFPTRTAYGAARRQEFHDAMETGGIQLSNAVELGWVDQEASLHLAETARSVARLLEQWNVEVVLVHPYEGGHPDHDAAAFAVHLACRLLAPGRRPEIVEFTSYHNRDGRICTGAFLSPGGTGELAIPLGADDRARKARMLSCYRTQQQTLQYFGMDEERFRIAPQYDFTRPPHPGQLFYERFHWGMSGSRWRALARAALEEFVVC